jgi:hypothetical protein
MLNFPPNGLFCDDMSDGQRLTNILVTNTEGDAKRNNDSGSDVEANVSWQESGDFNDQLMDYPNIGALPTHTYKAAAAYRFSDSFEGGFAQWTSARGTATASTAQAHDGRHSFAQDENGEVIYVLFPQRIYQAVGIWFYDDACDTSLDAMARVDERVGPYTWSSAGWYAMGVDTTTSTTHYTRWVGATVATTSVARTTGWHHLTWSYADGSGVTMAIDGTAVATSTGVRSFNKIAIGDFYNAGRTGKVFWDDVELSPGDDDEAGRQNGKRGRPQGGCRDGGRYDSCP